MELPALRKCFKSESRMTSLANKKIHFFKCKSSKFGWAIEIKASSKMIKIKKIHENLGQIIDVNGDKMISAFGQENVFKIL